MAVALTVVLAACAPPISPSKQSSQSKSHSNVDGHYKGSGSYVADISFDVSGEGATLSKFHGFITASCYTGGSLYSGQNQTTYNQYAMDDPDDVDVDDNDAFSSTYTIPDTKAGFTFEGTLDGKGGATGTVSYKNGACASITAPWSASLQGVKRPPIPGVTPSAPSQSGGTCSPQPCATIANMVLTIQGFHTASWPGHGNAPMLDLELTLHNTDTNGPEAITDRLWLYDTSGHGPVGPGVGINSLMLSSGETVQCAHGVQVQAGQSLSGLHWCYAQGVLDVTHAIRLDWNSLKGMSHLDLGTPG